MLRDFFQSILEKILNLNIIVFIIRYLHLKRETYRKKVLDWLVEKPVAAAEDKWMTILGKSVAEKPTNPRWSMKVDSVEGCKTWSL